MENETDLCNLPDEALEWQFAQKQLRAPLVFPDLSEGDCAWAIATLGFETGS
jgi:hypothetical protein